MGHRPENWPSWLDEFRHRPMVLIAVALASGMAVSFAPWVLVFGVSALAVALLGDRKALWGSIVLVSLLTGVVMRPPPVRELPLEASEARFERYGGSFVVDSVPLSRGAGLQAYATIRGERFTVRFPQGFEVNRGDLVSGEGEIGPTSEFAGYDLGSQGLLVLERAAVDQRGPPMWRVGAAWHRSFVESADGGLSEGSSRAMAAMVFNETSGLRLDDWDQFRRTGLIHILSASGFHVAVVTGLMLVLLSLLPVPRIVQLIVLGLVLITYAAAAGFRPPIVRAVMMSGLTLGAHFWRREGDGLSGLAAAVVGSLLLDPASVNDLGFHLSVVSVAVLVTYVSVSFGSRPKLSELVGYAFRASFASTLSTLPLIWFVFGEITLWGVLASVLLLPVVSILVWLGVISWLIGIVVPPLGDLLWRGPTEWLCTAFLRIVEWGSGLPGSSVVLPVLPSGAMVMFLLAGVLMWRSNERLAK